jgi:putative intracellular protease/amidase
LREAGHEVTVFGTQAGETVMGKRGKARQHTDLISAGAAWVDRDLVIDGNLITSQKPDDLPAFCKAILEKVS